MSNQKSEAAVVMRQADALIQRHRRAFVAGGEPGMGNDDVPVLTEVVDDASPSGRHETDLVQALEHWVAEKLPEIVAQSMAGMTAQLTEELAERLRAEFRKR